MNGSLRGHCFCSIPLHCVGVDDDDALGVEEDLEPLAPHALLDCFVVEVVEFLHGSSFLGAPQGVRLLLVTHGGGPLLVDVLDGNIP